MPSARSGGRDRAARRPPALVPVQPEPPQTSDHALDRLLGRRARIRVLDPQDERAAVVPGEQPVVERRPRVPDVQRPGRRRREPAAHSLMAPSPDSTACRSPRPRPRRRRPRRSGPTPSGVPVRITSPGSSVMNVVMYSISVATPNIMSAVCGELARPPRSPGSRGAHRSGRARSRSTARAGTNRRTLSPAPTGRPSLQVPQRHVVRAREAEDVRPTPPRPARCARAGRSRPRARPRSRRDGDRQVAGSGRRGPITAVEGLRKMQRFLGHVPSELGGVRGVVLARPRRPWTGARARAAERHRGESPLRSAPGPRRTFPARTRTTPPCSMMPVAMRSP